MASIRVRLPPRSLVEYGVIGDLHTAALLSKYGSLDWLCLPRLDSPSVFAALLDEERGGRFRASPKGDYRSSQRYVESTNVLRTDFAAEGGEATLTAFMPVQEIDRDEYASGEIHLLLEITSGRLAGDAEFSPRFDYARAPPQLELRPHGVLARAGDQSLVLSSDLPFQVDEVSAFAEWSGAAGDRYRFVLRYGTKIVRPVAAYATERSLAGAEAFWRAWTARASYRARWQERVARSALALKLLTYAPTGALAAAATTSLPESLGGTRNWDYRFTWVRDSAFAMRAFNALGHTREARRYLRWLRRLLRGLLTNVGDLRVGYGLEGETQCPEETLDHLSGYLDSRPVRIGNSAFEQLQLDIYGSLVDAIFEAYRTPEGYPDEAWRTARTIADHVAAHWQEPDHGIWEIRGPRRRYTHSALMCWVAMDRALRIAEARGQPDYNEYWEIVRAEIRQTILTRGWNAQRGAFVQSLDGHDPDASLLLIPLTGFLQPNDPRVQSTLDAVQAELGQGPFIHRYHVADALEGQEGAFLMCSFWMVHALALAGRVQEAQQSFEALDRLAGPLGLFSEEVDPSTGRALGNFPQALTHLSHINAALALNAALDAASPLSSQATPSP